MALSDYRSLLTFYVDEAISTDTFMHRFFDLHKQERTWLGPASNPLSQVFHALDAYVPDTGPERTKDDIDERQLREVVRQSLAEISRVEDSETRPFDTAHDVISGLADGDIGIRTYAAVVARDFPSDPVVLAALRARLSDPDNWVRLKTVESLGVLGDVGSFDQIVGLLETADGNYAPEAEAVTSLAGLEPSLRPRARAAITSWGARHHTRLIADNVALYLRRLGDDD